LVRVSVTRSVRSSRATTAGSRVAGGASRGRVGRGLVRTKGVFGPTKTCPAAVAVGALSLEAFASGLLDGAPRDAAKATKARLIVGWLSLANGPMTIGGLSPTIGTRAPRICRVSDPAPE